MGKEGGGTEDRHAEAGAEIRGKRGQVGLKLVLLTLPQSSWDYRYKPLYLPGIVDSGKS